jgi:Peptidase family M28/PA domain
MISAQSAFRTTLGAVTWACTAAVIFAGVSSLSAHADPAAGDPAAGDPAAGDPADQAMASIHAEAIRADMRFLADDLLEGRGIETQGYGVAARYMASQFEALGLQPAGSAGYLQNVPLRSSRIDEAKATLTWVRAGVPETLTLRQDYIPNVDPLRSETSVQAPVVFVGFGVTAKDQHYDDYEGIDAKGKIVAYIFGAPNFESSLRAHNSSSIVKRRNAVAHGAVGVILVDDPILEKLYSFAMRVREFETPGYHWLDGQGRPNDYFPAILAGASLSMEASKKFFEGSAHSAEQVYGSLSAGKPMSFTLPMVAKIHDASRLGDVVSPNVVAKLEGSDPALKSEYLVYTAHLDHLGIGPEVKGDKIYNGALDNASGSAILIETARAFSQMKPRPRRSILFVAVTAEESGLLGSDYFAHYPTVPAGSLVANVNMDEDAMLWPLRDIVAFGAEHSSLGGVVERAAHRLHLSHSPDPMPQQVVFIRSDQYSFVKQGIPAIFPIAGFKSSDPKIDPAAIFEKWEETRYHQPQDDMEQPGLDFNAAVQYAKFIFLCGYYVTQDPQRPRWNAGDFFGDLYGAGRIPN